MYSLPQVSLSKGAVIYPIYPFFKKGPSWQLGDAGKGPPESICKVFTGSFDLFPGDAESLRVPDVGQTGRL